MVQSHLGEIAALLVAFCWTVSAIAFESASKKVGSLAVNILRLIIGFIFLTAFAWVYRGLPFPTDATTYQWCWLSLSGFVGFVLGDLFLFKSFTIIGSRFAMLIMTLAPPITAVTGWFAEFEDLCFVWVRRVCVPNKIVEGIVVGRQDDLGGTFC